MGRKKKMVSKNVWNKVSYKYVPCKNPHNNPTCEGEVRVSVDAIGGICSNCCNRMVALPDWMNDSNKKKRPRGWQFMKIFVDEDGTVFFRGKEQPKLKGTMKPTKIKNKKVKRKSKKEKNKKSTKRNKKFF